MPGKPPEYTPTPEQIADACKSIQQGWKRKDKMRAQGMRSTKRKVQEEDKQEVSVWYDGRKITVQEQETWRA